MIRSKHRPLPIHLVGQGPLSPPSPPPAPPAAAPALSGAVEALRSTTVEAGQTLSFTLYDLNLGNAAAPASTTAVYLSNDSTITISDTLLTTQTVGTLQPYPAAGYYDEHALTVTIPIGMPAGAYYVGAIASYDDPALAPNPTYDVQSLTVTPGPPATPPSPPPPAPPSPPSPSPPPPSPPPPPASSSVVRLNPGADVTVFVAPPTGWEGAYWGSYGGSVTAGGSDTTGDGTQTAPWATIQQAWDWAIANLDGQGLYGFTIQLATAASPGSLYYGGFFQTGKFPGQGATLPPLYVGPSDPPFYMGSYHPVVLRGDHNNALGAFINPGEHGFAAQQGVSQGTDAELRIEGVFFDTAAAAMDCIDAFGALLVLDSVGFGDAGAPGDSYNVHIALGWGAKLIFDGPVWVNGVAASWLQGAYESVIQWNNNGDDEAGMTVTMGSTNQAFPQGAIVLTGAVLFMQGVDFVGTLAEGTKALVTYDGSRVINVPCPTTLWGASVSIDATSSCR